MHRLSPSAARHPGHPGRPHALRFSGQFAARAATIQDALAAAIAAAAEADAPASVGHQHGRATQPPAA